MLDDAFLQAIIESPDDDAPRLVYADWLEDHGDPARAEFIRVQCELAKLTDEGPRQAELQARERQLLATHVKEWAEPVQSVLEPWEDWDGPVRRRGWWRFHRGLIDTVALSAETFLERAEALFRVSPIRRITLQGAVGRTAHLAASPFLSRLVSLATEGGEAHIGDDGLRHLLSSPHLSRLRALRLVNSELGHAGLTALAGSPLLGRLAALTVAGGADGLADPAIEALAASPYLRGLKYLALVSLEEMGPSGARALATSSALAGLEALDLAFNRIGEEGCAAIAASPHLAGLRWLRLEEAGFGDRGVEALASSPSLGRLTHLFLGGNSIGDRAVEALAGSPNVQQLRTLGLSDTNIGDAGAAALAGSAHLRELRSLGLGFTAIGDEGVRALAGSSGLPLLTALGLSGAHVTDIGAALLAASPYLGRLRRLVIGESAISETGRRALQERFSETSTEVMMSDDKSGIPYDV
jgi:uncharacterized protein (TIGR02996 family)